jgi:hypothetical protein
MDLDSKSSTLNHLVKPEHLLQAIENALAHSGETTHGVTGLRFKKYTILVRQKKGYSWLVECKFKAGG